MDIVELQFGNELVSKKKKKKNCTSLEPFPICKNEAIRQLFLK